MLDHHLVHEDPSAIWLGELPRHYRQVPAPVVVNLCGVFPQTAPPVRVVLSLPFLDVPDQGLLPERALLERFLVGVHAHAASEASYWHCHAGINRASFVLAAYLHRHRGLRISEAIALLREKRSAMVLCNNVFERALREWYGDASEQAFEPLTFEQYLAEMRRHRALAAAREAEIEERDG